jgi:hypothetical protein
MSPDAPLRWVQVDGCLRGVRGRDWEPTCVALASPATHLLSPDRTISTGEWRRGRKPTGLQPLDTGAFAQPLAGTR